MLSEFARVTKSAGVDRWPLVGPFVRRGGRFMNRWAHGKHGVPAMIDGQVEVRLSPHAYSGGPYAFDPALTAELVALARPDRHFLDVGAHVGIASLVYAKLVGPGTRVCAIEPNPHVFPTLVENSRINGMRIECLDVALGAQSGHVAFFANGQDPNASLSGEAPQKYWYWADRTKPLMQETRVIASTLDQVCRDLDFVPGVIKLDVEGAELQVLRGGAEVLTRYQPLILLETHVFAWESFGYAGTDLEREVDRLGYVVCDRFGHIHSGPLGAGAERDNNHFLLKPR